jgi:hypothetical protein
MIQCPTCRITYVQNTLFCTECGLYLLESEDLGTDPFETDEQEWMGEANSARRKPPLLDSGPLTICLRIGGPCTHPTSSGRSRARLPQPAGAGPASVARRPRPSEGRRSRPAPAAQAQGGRLRKRDEAGELEIPLTRPIRLGRIDPTQDIYPEVDLSSFLGLECGVSREHALIVRRGNVIEVEDLASTNGTLLNGKRLSPYLPVPLQDGDLLQLGKLLIEVGLSVRPDQLREQAQAAPFPSLGAPDGQRSMGALPA